jgi:CubicO group peptidase (beta-lactamase class C family)
MKARTPAAGTLTALAAAMLVLATASPAGAVSASRRDSLRAYLDGLAAFGFTGQVVVAEGDSTLAEIAAGRTAPNGVPVSPATCFAAGSIAKSLTAAAVVRLAARGTLSLDDPLGRHLPETPAERAAITLRQLLTHTSGLAENGGDVAEADARDTVVRKILATAPVAGPGARFAYSNAGYELLAAVIERATGTAYADFVRAEFLEPAGMTTSGFGPAGAARCAEAADGRNEWGVVGSLRTWRQAWAGTGAGDLVTTGRDLARWARALQGDGPLAAAELDTLLAPRVAISGALRYGFGAYVVTAGAGATLISIGGDVPGYHAAAWIERRAPWRITVVVSSGERLGRGLPVSAVQQALWGILDGKPVVFPPATVPWPFAAAGAIAGGWSLPGGGRLELTPDGDGPASRPVGARREGSRVRRRQRWRACAAGGAREPGDPCRHAGARDRPRRRAPSGRVPAVGAGSALADVLVHAAPRRPARRADPGNRAAAVAREWPPHLPHSAVRPHRGGRLARLARPGPARRGVRRGAPAPGAPARGPARGRRSRGVGSARRHDRAARALPRRPRPGDPRHRSGRKGDGAPGEVASPDNSVRREKTHVPSG